MRHLSCVIRREMVIGLAKLCHPDRSIAIGFINRNAEWRDLLLEQQ